MIFMAFKEFLSFQLKMFLKISLERKELAWSELALLQW